MAGAQLGGVTTRLRRSSGLGGFSDQMGGDLRVARRGRQPGVAEQRLDDADVCPRLQQVRGEAVPQGMDGDRLAQVGSAGGLPAGVLQGGDAHRLRRILAREQPPARSGQPPVGTQDPQQLRRQHDIAILAALALDDADQHPAAVDRRGLQGGNLGDAQPGPIGRGQGHAVAQAGHRFEEAHHLLAAQHHGQALRLPRSDDPLIGVRAAERHAKEEAQRTDGLIDVRP
jgi:hypothetical protein